MGLNLRLPGMGPHTCFNFLIYEMKSAARLSLSITWSTSLLPELLEGRNERMHIKHSGRYSKEGSCCFAVNVTVTFSKRPLKFNSPEGKKSLVEYNGCSQSFGLLRPLKFQKQLGDLHGAVKIFFTK